MKKLIKLLRKLLEATYVSYYKVIIKITDKESSGEKIEAKVVATVHKASEYPLVNVEKSAIKEYGKDYPEEKYDVQVMDIVFMGSYKLSIVK